MLFLWIILIVEAFALDDGVCIIKNQTVVKIPGDAILTGDCVIYLHTIKQLY